MAKEYSVFISHSWQNSEDLENLRTLLEERGYFHVEFTEASKDEPINSENAVYIKRRLAEKIGSSDIVIGLAGIYASHSEWMEWELDKAITLDIPIICVVPQGQERISQVVSTRAKEVVRWNTDSIVRAIREHSKS